MHNFSRQKRSKTGPQGPKMKILKKYKKRPPIYKCTKFQKISIISTACPKVKKHTDRYTHIVRF